MTTACGDQGTAESHSHLPQELSTKLASNGQGALELGDIGAEEQCCRLGKWRPLRAGSQSLPVLNATCKLASFSPFCITDAPRSLRLTYLLESRGGQLALVLCTVDSRPPAQLVLSHAGRLLASSTTASAPNTLQLELWEPGPSDEGLYSCSARSPLGQVNTSLELRLEGEAGPSRGGISYGVLPGPADPVFLVQVCR